MRGLLLQRRVYWYFCGNMRGLIQAMGGASTHDLSQCSIGPSHKTSTESVGCHPLSSSVASRVVLSIECCEGAQMKESGGQVCV